MMKYALQTAQQNSNLYDVDGGYAPNGKEEGQMQMEMFKENFLLAGEMLAGLLEMGKV